MVCCIERFISLVTLLPVIWSPRLTSHVSRNAVRRCRGPSDEAALRTSPRQPTRHSAALVASAKLRPVHSAMLSAHFFRGRPLLLPPFTVPCKQIFAKPQPRVVWPNHFIFLVFTILSSSWCFPISEVTIFLTDTCCL